MKPLLRKIHLLVIKIISEICTKFIISKYLKKHEVKKLHLGAGGRIIKNWLNTDSGNKKVMPVIDITKKGVDSYVGDISNLDSILPAFKNIDTVVHLAGDRRFHGDWNSILNNNITINIIY